MKKNYFTKIFNIAHLGWVQLFVLLLVSVGAFGQGVGYNSSMQLQGPTSAVVTVTIGGSGTTYELSPPAAWGGACGHDTGNVFQDISNQVIADNVSEISISAELLQASPIDTNRYFALEYLWYHESESIDSSQDNWESLQSNVPGFSYGATGSSGCDGNRRHNMAGYTLPLSSSGKYTLKVRIRMHNSQDGNLGNSNNYHGSFKSGYTATFSYSPETIHFTADGSTDFELSSNGDGSYSAEGVSVSGGNGYFYNKLADTSTDEYWAGVTNFPSGTAASSGSVPGTKIGSTAGLYNVTFTPSTGAYTFTAILGSVQKITSAKVTMDVYDVLTGTTDTNWYVLNGTQSTLACHEDVGNLDFNPADNSFIHTVGVNSTLKIGGEALTNNDPNPIKIHYRVYQVGAAAPAFTTRELDFRKFLTSGTECGNVEGQNGTEYYLTASGGSAVTLSTAGNYYIEVYFEAGESIASGYGKYSAGAGGDNVTMTGPAVGGWAPTADVSMGYNSTHDSYHYYNYTVSTGDMKFRENNDWATNWGFSNFPYDTSENGANIPITAGTYNITFDRGSSDYHFAPYTGTSTYFNNSDGSNYKALIKVVDVIDDTGKDTNDGSFGFTDGALDPGCTQCSGLYESYMGLYIIDADGAVVADEVYNLDGAYGSSNTSNLDLGAHFPGVTFRIGTEVKAWAKGKHKMCGCSSWYYTYEFDGTDPIESDFPLPASGAKFSDTSNGLFTLMNTSEDLGTNTPMPLNPTSTAAGQGSGHFSSTVNTSITKGANYQNNIKGFNIRSYNHSDFYTSNFSLYKGGTSTDVYFLEGLNGYKSSGGAAGNWPGTDPYDTFDLMIYDHYITSAEAASWFKIRFAGGWGGPNWGGDFGDGWSYPNESITSSGGGTNMTGIPEGNYTIYFDRGTGAFAVDTMVLYRWKDFQNAAKTSAVVTPYNEVSCSTCGGEFKVAVAMLCWASDAGDCTDETSLYYHRDINQNKVHEGVALNPHHPNSSDKPAGSVDNTYEGTELFYVQKISIASGGAENTWNGSTWSVTGAAYPESYQDATVNSDLTISQANSFTCINLEVADGVTITLESGAYLEVLREAITNGTGKIVVPSDANFVQRCDNQGHTAHIVHTKNTRTIAVGDYAYLSSPIQGDMIPYVTAAGMGRMYEWSNNTETDKNWSTISTTVGKSGEGFIAWNPPSKIDGGLVGGSIKSFSIEIDGIATNGEVTVNVLNADLDINNDDNYVLIGNPYACALDSELFLTHPNNSNIDGTLYYWSSNSRIQDGDANGGYGDYNAYDYNPGDYASWSLSGATATAAAAETTNDTLVGNNSAPTKWWPSATSVFMRPIADGTVYFNNSMRSTNNPDDASATNSATLFRSGNRGDRVKSRIYLNINNGKGDFKQMGIAYVPGGTKGHDRLFDSELYSSSKANLYTVNNSRKYSIEGRPYKSLNENETIPLGYNSENEDDFQISIDRFDGNFDAKEIFLRDIKKDTLHNLSDRPYIFSTLSGTYDDRFELVIKDKERLIEDIEPTTSNPLIVAVKSDKIIVTKSNEKITKIEIHSLLGKKLHTEEVDLLSTTTIEGLKRNDQIVIVTVFYEDGYKEHKKVLY